MASSFDIKDFRGGYFTDVPSELMADNELLQAQDCYWDNGLKKRKGLVQYASITGRGSIKGAIRYDHLGTWKSVMACEVTSSGVQLFYGSTTAFTTMTMASGTGMALTTGYDVQFASLGDKIIGVNGVDRPIIVYNYPGTATLVMANLDQYGTIERSTDNWYAGFQESATSVFYTDYTTEAQDTTASDFCVASTSSTSGFYITGDTLFTKFIMTGFTGVSATMTVDYQYWDGSSFTSIPTMDNSPQWKSTGTVTCEWEIPMSTDGTLKWQRMATTESNFANRYCMKTLFATQGTAAFCTNIDLYQTHALTQTLGDDRPQAVAVHKNTVFLGAENYAQIGAQNSVTDWAGDQWEYYQEGGKQIVGMITHGNYLAILKENAIYGELGDSWANWSVQHFTNKGCVAPRGFVVANDILWYVAQDGIYGWDGNKNVCVSKHIQTDIDNYTLSTACATLYKGYVYFVFPANGRVLMFDPDTYRTDPVGDGRVSFYKLTYPSFTQVLNWDGAGDLKYLVGFSGNDIVQCDTTYYDTFPASATINMQMQTKYYSMNKPNDSKCFKRAYPTVADVSVTSGAYYNFKMYMQDEYGEVSSTATLTAGVGTNTGLHKDEISVPYTIDGGNIGFYVGHDGLCNAKVYSFSLDLKGRNK